MRLARIPLLAALLLAGCMTPAPGSTTDDIGAQSATGSLLAASAVVADVGYGPNVYHEAYRRPTWTHHPSTVIPGFPADAPALNLTLGDDFDANVEADAALWKDLAHGVYWIPGTNLLYAYYGQFESVPPPPHDYLHGTATAGAVNDACPECYVLVVRHAEMHLAAGVQLVADEMPWVDVVTQTGSVGSGDAHPAAAKALWDSGRVFVGPSGNRAVAGLYVALVSVYPMVGPTLPPWLIGVGGSAPECHAVEPLAGAPADYVADFFQDLPAPNTTTERVPISGTSFSAPAVAGAMGQALLDLRRAAGNERAPGLLWKGEPRASFALEDGELTVAELRQAFDASARYFAPTDFEPGCVDANQLSVGVPAPPAPWTKMGWGHVDRETAATVTAVLLGAAELPTKDEQAVAFMDAYMRVRETYYSG